MSDTVIERATQVLNQSVVRQSVNGDIDIAVYEDGSEFEETLARALDDAGLLVSPEHDAAVAAEWADHFEVCQGTVGIERLTVESMIAALRGPRPFGCMAGESDADA